MAVGDLFHPLRELKEFFRRYLFFTQLNEGYTAGNSLFDTIPEGPFTEPAAVCHEVKGKIHIFPDHLYLLKRFPPGYIPPQ
jgi:hypothetical protein